MADIMCFYQDLKTKPKQVNKFDYASAVVKLRNTYKQFNTGSFTWLTDHETEHLKDIDYHREVKAFNLDGTTLMENVCQANIHAVRNRPGRYIMCGCDHLINGNIDKLFRSQYRFDIGIMMIKGRVNNTVILVNSDYDTHEYVEEFFRRRYDVYRTLDRDMKQWGGDQYAITQLLRDEGVLPEKPGHRPLRTYSAMGLQIRLFDYHTSGISGVSKSGPVYDPKASFIDFKGPKRKRFYDKIYTYISLKGDQAPALIV